MRTIFRNSTVTIAVANACSVYGGFPRLRIPTAASELRLSCPDGAVGSVSLMPHRYCNAMKEPINPNAWTMEERVMPLPVLFYGQRDVSWQCQTDISKSTAGLHSALTEGCKRQPSYVFKSSPLSKLNNDRKFTHDRALLWIEIVENYTRRELTHEKDKTHRHQRHSCSA